MRLRALVLGCLLPIAVAIAPSVARAQRVRCRPNFLRLDECGPRFDDARIARRADARERAESRAFDNAMRTESRSIAAAERADRHRMDAETRIRERRYDNDLARRTVTRVRVNEPRVRVDVPRIRIRSPRQ